LNDTDIPEIDLRERWLNCVGIGAASLIAQRIRIRRCSESNACCDGANGWFKECPNLRSDVVVFVKRCLGADDRISFFLTETIAKDFNSVNE